MLSLNLIPSSSVTSIKFNHQCSKDASWRFNPNLLCRVHCHGNKQCCRTTSQLYDAGSQAPESTQVHGLSSASSLRPKLRIQEKVTVFGFSAKPRNQIVQAASQVNPEAEGESADSDLKARLSNLLWFLVLVLPKHRLQYLQQQSVKLFPISMVSCLFPALCWFYLDACSLVLKASTMPKNFKTLLLGPALFHTIGHVSACVSFSKVAVSFTHVIKSAEPVLSVIFSSFIGDRYPIQVCLSIIPIVLGCSLAAVTEVYLSMYKACGVP